MNTEEDLVEEGQEPIEQQSFEESEQKPRQHVRAGFTTNKGHGQSKQRRKMAAKSRRINRKRQ
jgi:hypothetical protein